MGEPEQPLEYCNTPNLKHQRWALLFPNNIIFENMMVQATLGCSYGRCGFCYIHTDPEIPFRLPSLDEVRTEFTKVYNLCKNIGGLPYQPGKQAFLSEANALVRTTEDLVAILDFLHGFEPIKDTLEKVSVYARCDTVLEKERDGSLARLRNAGLTDVFMGFESGDDKILRMVNKGYETATIREAVAALKHCGYRTHGFVISGLGGKERSAEHVAGTAALINELQPDTVYISPLTLSRLTSLGKRCLSGEFTNLSPEKKAEEEISLVESLDLTTRVELLTCFRCGGVSSAGNLPTEKGKITKHLGNPEARWERYRSCAPEPL